MVGDATAAVVFGKDSVTSARTASCCTEADVFAATCVEDAQGDDEVGPRYVCQTTQLCEFTKPLPWWNLAQYVDDYRSRNVTLTDLLHGALYVLMGRRGGRRIPALRRIHDALQFVIGGPASPVRTGSIPLGSPVPKMTLGLKPGDLVRVKSHAEILSTINAHNWHGGLYFDVEMVPFCGRTYRVRTRVERFIDEKTGRIRQMKTPTVILEGVACKSKFSKCRMFCPRSLHSWWREEWLERVPEVRADAGLGDDNAAPIVRPERRPIAAAETAS